MNLNYFKQKSIFITGHTGFKGAWLSHILKRAGACVYGYALEPVSGGVFEVAKVADCMHSIIGDVRDYQSLSKAFREANPDIVIHLAAQPIVLESYHQPAYTFETNVMGTVNILECIRRSSVKSAVIVTTDKVYKNDERNCGFVESDELGGSDPYAASKACAEIAAESYRKSFLQSIPMSTVRAGNVIGGGDVSDDRIIPDCVRAAVANNVITVRNPLSVRPYQHVLEPLFAYLLIAEKQSEDPELASGYNIGPYESDSIETGKLADIFCKAWGNGAKWDKAISGEALHESSYLRLDCAKMQTVLNWKPVWDVETAVIKTVEWEKARFSGADVCRVMDKQIDEYMEAVT